MSRFVRPESDLRDQAARAGRHERRVRHRKRGCGNPPAVPTGLTGSFDRAEGGRGGHRIRANLKWDEVKTDTDGLPHRVRRYLVELEYSANGVDWFLSDRFSVPAKRDSDPNDKAHKIAKGIKARLQYRFTVEAIDEDGCRSGPSAPFVLGAPNDETPPAPSNVRIYANDKGNRIIVDWDDTPDPNDTDRRRDDQDYFIVHWSKTADFSTIYRRDRRVHRTQAGLKVREVDEGDTFYARVIAVNDAGDKNYKSLPIPATLSGNNDPNATPDGVKVGQGGALRHVLVWTIHGKWRVGRLRKRWIADDTYTFRKARIYAGEHNAADHPNDGCPQGDKIRVQGFVAAADDSSETPLFDTNDRLVVDPNTHKDVNWASTFNVSQITDGQTLSWEVKSVGSTFPGKDGTIHLVVEK